MGPHFGAAAWLGRRSAAAASAGALLALLAAACGPAPLGHGVVLWSDGGALPAGAVILVLEESSIENRYMVRPGAAERGAEPVPVARWRVRVFPEPEQAAAFAARYAPFAASYGYAARNGLPVRNAASATADIVYKLRAGEVAKVMERSAQPEQVGVYENYWYEVLAADGTTGYTFGEFLPVFESRGDPQAEAARLLAEDATLEHLLATVWRPDEFRAMVVTGRYDLNRFRAEYGLFPDPAAQVFRLVTAAGTREFAYESIERVGDGRYVLLLEDSVSRLRLTLQSATRLAMTYADGARTVTRIFAALRSDVTELIAAELARRDQRYARLLARGAVWRSTGYGTIELDAERGYRWRGFQALVPGLVPAGLPGSGWIDFRYAPGEELAGRYDAVITFLFAPPGAAGPPPEAADPPPEAADPPPEAADPPPADANPPPGAPDPPLAVAPLAAGPGAAADSGAPPATAGPPPAEAAPPGAADSPPEAAGPPPAEAAPPGVADSPSEAADPPPAETPPANGPSAGADSAAAGQADPAAAAARPAPAFEPAAEFTVLAEYDANGIRLTPAQPDPVTLLVTEVSPTPVVMYFSVAD